MGLGNGYNNGQDTDELEDGSQEESVAQQVLQEGGLRHLGRREVQVGGHGPRYHCPPEPKSKGKSECQVSPCDL